MLDDFVVNKGFNYWIIVKIKKKKKDFSALIINQVYAFF